MIFAKLNGKAAEHRILFEDDHRSERFAFFLIPTIADYVRFNPDKKLETNEWYYVDLDDEQVKSMVEPYFINEESSADLNPVQAEDYETVETVYRVIEKAVVFSKITDGFRIKNRKIMRFDTGETQLVDENDSIIFKGNKDAYFDGEHRLFFKKFSSIRSLFPGIDVFYREATKEEKEQFLENDLFDVLDVTADQIGSRDASRIAAVLKDESIGLSDGSNREKIIEAAQDFEDVNLEISEENKLVIKDTKQLRTVLNLLTSRYYVSNITGQKMESFGSAAIEEH